MKEFSDFKKFYHDYENFVRQTLYRLVGPQLLDDAVQEAFLKIWHHKDSFKSHSSIKTWIYRITVNAGIDLLRKQKIFSQLPKEEKSEEFKDKVIENEIYNTLMEISLDYRLVLNAIIFDEMSIKETSEALEIPEGTVKSRLFRGKEMMKERLKEKGYDHG